MNNNYPQLEPDKLCQTVQRVAKFWSYDLVLTRTFSRENYKGPLNGKSKDAVYVEQSYGIETKFTVNFS